MIRTPRRSFARLAVVGLSAAALFSACSSTATPSTAPASQAPAGSPAASAAEHKPVTIRLGYMAPFFRKSKAMNCSEG